MLITVVVVFNNLDGKGNLFLDIGESGHTNLSVDRGVGIPAVVLGTVPIGGGVVGKSHKRQQSQDESLKIKVKFLIFLEELFSFLLNNFGILNDFEISKDLKF